MPVKSAQQIEDTIAAKVESRKFRTRGVWWTVRRMIELRGNQTPGDVRMFDGAATNADDLASLGGGSAETVLVCLRQLQAVGLLRQLDNGVWHSPPLARLIEMRQTTVERVRRHRRALRNALYDVKGVTKRPCNALVTPYGPSPPSLSPTPPISNPPTPEYPDAAHPAGDGSSANGKPSGRKKAKPPKFPEGVWDRAVEGWGRAFRHVHGSEFHWDSRQAGGLSKVLTALKGDVARFEVVAKAWLREPEQGPVKGHPLWQLAVDLNYVESKIARGTVGQPAGNGATVTETPEQYARRLSAAGS